MSSNRASLATGAALGAVAGFLALELGLSMLISYWGDQTWLPVAGAVTGAALASLPSRAQPLRRAAEVGLCLLVALWAAVLVTPLTRWMAEPLARRDPLRRADAIFVFSAQVQPDGEPAASSLSRILHGAELVSEGHAPALVISELPLPWAQYAPWTRQTLSRLGIEAELFVVAPILRTRDEALGLARLCSEKGWRRVISVTSPSHSRRAALSLETVGLEVISSPALEPRWDEPGLSFRSDRLGAFGNLAHEWVGLAYYRWRGWAR